MRRPLQYLYYVLCLLVTNFLVDCYGWSGAIFNPDAITLQSSSNKRVGLILSDLEDDVENRINDRSFLQLHSSHEDIAIVRSQDEIIFQKINDNRWQTEFDVSGVFLGASKIRVMLSHPNREPGFSDESLEVIVLRPQRIIDSVFIYSVIIFLGIIFINFGAALNMSNIKLIFRKPVGAVIGIIGTFVFMPLIAYGMGSLLFQNMDPDHEHIGHALALGLFFCGIVPGGGFSSVFTLFSGGNIDLSVSMTTISTLAAFGMIPLWIFSLGRIIFEQANIIVPYVRIVLTAIGLALPLGIGVIIRKWKPKAANFMTRILKPLSVVLLIFIGVFAIVSNFFMFQLFTWQIVVAGLGLPCLGYIFGFLIAKIFCQPNEDAIAISIEIGYKNTGMAIFLLTALEQPMADLTQVVPVAVTLLSPLPLIVCIMIMKIKSRFFDKQSDEQNDTAINDSYNQSLE